MARRFAAGEDLPERFKRSLFFVDRENRDAVVAAVRGVEKFSGGMHGDLGGFLWTRIILRERGNGLQGRQAASFRLIREDRHGRLHLIKQVSKLTVGMKRKMARAGAWLHLCEAGEQGGKNSFDRVEAVNDDLIESQVRDKGETIVWRSTNPVRMWTFLTLLIQAGAGMLNETAGGAESTVIVNGKRDDAATVVIRDQHECAILVEGYVARSSATRGHLIQKLERAGFRVDGKRADR